MMKELIIFILAFQIVFFIAEAESQKLPRHYEETLLSKIKHSVSPGEITFIEKFNTLKDFYPDGGIHHVLRKRNAAQAMMDMDGTGSVSRRRKTKKRRRRKQKDPLIEATLEPRNEISERPVLREGGRRRTRVEASNGLLRAKELQANYIKTDNMRANRLQADMIKADMIKAQDVVVTSKRRKSRRRPSFGELVDPGIGIERINSLTDGPNFDQNNMDLLNKNENSQFESRSISQEPSLFDSQFPQKQSIADNSKLFQEQRIADNSQLFQEQSIADNSQLFKQQNIDEFSPDQGTKIKNKRRLSQSNTLSSIQQTEALPEFSSSHVLNKIPKLSEFITDYSPYVQKRIHPNFKQQDTFVRGAPPPLTSSGYNEFTNMEAQNFGIGENTDQTLDNTVKTYMKDPKTTGPWFF
ncbi:uncharacterized protein LOC134715966 [Mytilus trossulus]|uniref:uncharacterized protein LOC134715966 n=1 Tax=Mytilus trossulus TaxID=6551 RepID=UPI003004C833